MGRQHLGERVYLPTRLDPELAALVRADAERLDVPAGDVIGGLMADHYDRPELAPIRIQRIRAAHEEGTPRLI